MWTRALRPLQLGVQRVQDVELHGLEEAVALVLKYNGDHHLASILQVPLDVVHLGGKKEKKRKKLRKVLEMHSQKDSREAGDQKWLNTEHFHSKIR